MGDPLGTSLSYEFLQLLFSRIISGKYTKISSTPFQVVRKWQSGTRTEGWGNAVRQMSHQEEEPARGASEAVSLEERTSVCVSVMSQFVVQMCERQRGTACSVKIACCCCSNLGVLCTVSHRCFVSLLAPSCRVTVEVLSKRYTD